VFTSSSFNNRFEHESSLFEPISSKLTSSLARLHPYVWVVVMPCGIASGVDHPKSDLIGPLVVAFYCASLGDQCCAICT
jgi:hypothetical protein